MHREDEVSQTGGSEEALKQPRAFNTGDKARIKGNSEDTFPWIIADEESRSGYVFVYPAVGDRDALHMFPVDSVITEPNTEDVFYTSRAGKGGVDPNRKEIMVMDAQTTEVSRELAHSAEGEPVPEDISDEMADVAIDSVNEQFEVSEPISIDVFQADSDDIEPTHNEEPERDVDELITDKEAKLELTAEGELSESDKREQARRIEQIKEEVFKLIPEAMHQFETNHYEIDRKFETLLGELYEDVASIQGLTELVSDPDTFSVKARELEEKLSQTSLKFHQFGLMDLQTLLDRVAVVKRELNEQKRFASQQDAAAIAVAREKGAPIDSVERATDSVDALGVKLEPFTRQTYGALSMAQTLSAKVYSEINLSATEILHLAKTISKEDAPHPDMSDDQKREFIERRGAPYIQSLNTIIAGVKEAFGEDVEEHRRLISEMKLSVQHAIEGLSMAYATRKPEQETK